MTFPRSRPAFASLAAPILALLAGCATAPRDGSGADPVVAAYTVVGEGGQAWLRVVTRAAQCPTALGDGQPLALATRAPAATLPARGKGDKPPVVFTERSCEAALPAGLRQLSVGERRVPLPAARINRVVLIGDTGCRLKAPSEYQDCNDARQWPFATVAQRAAALQPDLVVHLGDLVYRESPCPAGRPGCAGSPWGFGGDVWAADFFEPARPLLAAAPWVMVRGNHESCARAGQGWFRFADVRPWTEARSCNTIARDGDADFSEPFAVPLDADTQLIVFDSAAAAGKPLAPDQPAYARYRVQFERAAELARKAPHSLFLNHHPLLAFHGEAGEGQVKPGNAALQSVAGALNPGRYLPRGVDLSLHGHVHTFESVSFAGDVPAALVVGNSGSGRHPLPDRLPPGAQVAPGLSPESYVTWPGFGFATLDRTTAGWQLTQWDTAGRAVLGCALAGTRSDCRWLDNNRNGPP